MPEHTPAPTPSRSLYGFFLYLFSKTTLTMFCIWAFTPDSFLHYFNICYYPQKYWSTALPIQFLVALTVFAFLIYPSINMILTPHIDSPNTFQDKFSDFTGKANDKTFSSNGCICQDSNNCEYKSYVDSKENAVPHLIDIDIKSVCKKLYYVKK